MSGAGKLTPRGTRLRLLAPLRAADGRTWAAQSVVEVLEDFGDGFLRVESAVYGAQAIVPFAAVDEVTMTASTSDTHTLVNRIRGAVGMEPAALDVPHEASANATVHKVRALVERGNRLASAVASISTVLRDVERDTLGGTDVGAGWSAALVAVNDLVDSVADDLRGVGPAKAARDVLAAAGWTEDTAGDWTHVSGRFIELFEGSVLAYEHHGGFVAMSPVEARAFATLAEENQP